MRPLALTAVLLCAACQCGQKLTPVSEDLTASPNPLDFGELKPGQSKTLNVTVHNNGIGPTTLHPFIDSAVFSVPLVDIALMPGGSHVLAVTFAPTTEGTFNASLSISSSLTVDLTGRSKGVVTSCVSKSCADLARTCGSVADDGCGNPLDCGSCGNGATCELELGVCHCGGAVEICGNGIDDDCDGLADCADGECASTAACSCIATGAETCGNGTDDDCDGQTDCADSDCASSPACVTTACAPGTEVRVTNGPRIAAGADIAFNGTQLGLSWMYSDSTTTSGTGLNFGFASLDGTGTVVTGPVDATMDGLMAHPPRIAWSGTDWAIASATVSSDGSKNLIQVRRMSSSGTPGASVITLGQGWPASVAADPSSGELGVLWGVTALGNQPALTLISSTMSVGANNEMNTGGNWDDYGDVVRAGTGWGAVWTQSINSVQGVYFGRFDASGVGLGAPQQLDAAQPSGAYFPRIAWTGSTYAVTYNQGASVFFRRYDSTGNAIGTPVEVSSTGGAADIAWTGTAFAIVWEDSRAAKATIWLTEIDANGLSVGMPRQVSCGLNGSSRPAVTATATKIAVSWHDFRNTPGIDVYVKLVDP